MPNEFDAPHDARLTRPALNLCCIMSRARVAIAHAHEDEDAMNHSETASSPSIRMSLEARQTSYLVALMLA